MNWTLFSEKEQKLEDGKLIVVFNSPNKSTAMCIVDSHKMLVDTLSNYTLFFDAYAWCKMPTKEDVDKSIDKEAKFVGLLERIKDSLKK